MHALFIQYYIFHVILYITCTSVYQHLVTSSGFACLYIVLNHLHISYVVLHYFQMLVFDFVYLLELKRIFVYHMIHKLMQYSLFL